MAEKQQYCLKWNNYQSNVTTTFKELLEVEDFVDITLSAEGKTLKAHKVVLSACSTYFRELLKGISLWQHPVIVLKDVPYSDLQGIVEFIYHGEVSVDQEALPSFLKTAELLRVKGLTEDGNSTADTSSETPTKTATHHPRKSAHPTKSVQKRYVESDGEVAAPPSKKLLVNSNNSKAPKPVIKEDQAEVSSEESLQEPPSGGEEEDFQSMLHQYMSTPEGNMDDEGQIDRQTLLMAGGDVSFPTSSNDPDSFPQALGLPHLKSVTSPGGAGGMLNSQKKTCPYCFQQLSWHALSRHIRDMHRAKTGFVTCKYCLKMFRNKNSLGCHMWRFHKDLRDKDQAKDDVNTTPGAPQATSPKATA